MCVWEQQRETEIRFVMKLRE